MLLARRRATGLTPSKLSSVHRRLVIDASVLINLLGTRSPAIVLRTLRRIFVIDEITLREVTLDPATRRSAQDVLTQLQAERLLEVIHMGSEAYDQFIEFTGAQPPDDLDDGEAAVLAQAAFGNCVAVIDERKATRIARQQLPNLIILNSIDLLAAPQLLHELGRDRVSDAIYLALRDARMRVPRNVRPWIATLLGYDRVQDCPTLGPFHPENLLRQSMNENNV
jgi:hypothetical protein